MEQRPDGLVRITPKKALRRRNGAADMDPQSLLCRLATNVPSPRLHTIRYAGVLAPTSPWRSRLAPKPPPQDATLATEPEPPRRAGGGEELGGLRGLAFHMQRVALEGARPAIEKIVGEAGSKG